MNVLSLLPGELAAKVYRYLPSPAFLWELKRYCSCVCPFCGHAVNSLSLTHVRLGVRSWTTFQVIKEFAVCATCLSHPGMRKWIKLEGSCRARLYVQAQREAVHSSVVAVVQSSVVPDEEFSNCYLELIPVAQSWVFFDDATPLGGSRRPQMPTKKEAIRVFGPFPVEWPREVLRNFPRQIDVHTVDRLLQCLNAAVFAAEQTKVDSIIRELRKVLFDHFWEDDFASGPVKRAEELLDALAVGGRDAKRQRL